MAAAGRFGHDLGCREPWAPRTWRNPRFGKLRVGFGARRLSGAGAACGELPFTATFYSPLCKMGGPEAQIEAFMPRAAFQGHK